MPDGLVEKYAGLSVIGACLKLSQDDIEYFQFEHCRLWHLNALQMQRIFGFVLKPYLVGCFLCLNSIFNLLFHNGVSFFASLHEVVSIHRNKQQMKLLLL